MPVFLSDYCGLYVAVVCKVNEKIVFCAEAAKNRKICKRKLNRQIRLGRGLPNRLNDRILNGTGIGFVTFCFSRV